MRHFLEWQPEAHSRRTANVRGASFLRSLLDRYAALSSPRCHASSGLDRSAHLLPAPSSFARLGPSAETGEWWHGRGTNHVADPGRGCDFASSPDLSGIPEKMPNGQAKVG